MFVGSALVGRNGIEIANVDGFSILDCKFENTNTAVKLIPTGYRQAIRRGYITNCEVLNSNYGIYMPKISDEEFANVVPIGDLKSLRAAGDLKIANFKSISSKYTAINLYGSDGLQISDALIFSPDSTDAVGVAVKLHNIKLSYCTYVNITNAQLSEAGSHALVLEESDNVRASNLHIAWPGQRLPGSGLYVVRNTEVPDTLDVKNRTLAISMVNTFIENPTQHGIYLTGNIETKDYQFSNISISQLGSKHKWVGGSNANHPDSNVHYSIWSDPKFKSVIFTGVTDSFFPKTQPRILGSGFWEERNSYSGASKSEFVNVASTDATIMDRPGSIAENRLSRSNSFTENAYYAMVNLVPTTVDNLVGPLGKLQSVTKLTESGGYGNLQHAFYTQTGTNISITKRVGDTTAFTYSGYFKAEGRKFISITANTSIDGFGIVADFDLETGTATYSRGGSGNLFLSGQPTIRRASNGWWKVIMSFVPKASNGGIRFGFYVKEKIQSQNSSYSGTNGKLAIWICNFQVTQTPTEIDYTPTDESTGPVAKTNLTYIKMMEFTTNNSTTVQTKTLLNSTYGTYRAGSVVYFPMM